MVFEENAGVIYSAGNQFKFFVRRVASIGIARNEMTLNGP